MKTAFCVLIVSMFAFVGCNDKSRPCKCEDSMVAPCPCPCPTPDAKPCPKCPKCPKCPDCPKCDNPACPDGCDEDCDCGCHKVVGDRVIAGEVKSIRNATSPDGGLWISLKDNTLDYRVLGSAEAFVDGIPKKLSEIAGLVGPATFKVKMTFCKRSLSACKCEFYAVK